VDGNELCIHHQLVTGSRGWNAVNIVLSYGITLVDCWFCFV